MRSRDRRTAGSCFRTGRSEHALAFSAFLRGTSHRCGNSDHFGYRILGGQIRDTSFIYEWDHESDDRVWFATDLEDYFRRCVPKG